MDTTWIDEQEARLDEFCLLMSDIMELKHYRGTKEYDRRRESIRKRLSEE